MRRILLLSVTALTIVATISCKKQKHGMDKDGNFLLTSRECRNIERRVTEKNSLLAILISRNSKATFLRSAHEGVLRYYAYKNVNYFLSDSIHVQVAVDSGFNGNAYVYDDHEPSDFLKLVSPNHEFYQLIEYELGSEVVSGGAFQDIIRVSCYKRGIDYENQPGWIYDSVYDRKIGEHAYDSMLVHMDEANALLRKAVADGPK